MKRQNKLNHLSLASLSSWVGQGLEPALPTQTGPGFTRKYGTRLERLAREKHSSHFVLSIGDEEKTFYDIFTRNKANFSPSISEVPTSESSSWSSPLTRSALAKLVRSDHGHEINRLQILRLIDHRVDCFWHWKSVTHFTS